MPRAIWSGAISFGLVNIPVKLYSAVSRKTVRFNQIDAESGQRIRQQRVNPETGEEVPYEQIVKGYEISPDKYVVITPEELESLDPKKTRTIDIEDFVDLDQIDPLYYEHPYYLVPDTGAAKPYKLLLSALQESNKVAIARVVIRSKEYLTAIRPADGVLTLETMLFADELVPTGQLDELPDEDVNATEREIQMAMQLIESLTTEFDPTKYRDTYREAVLDLIERKAEGEEITIEAAPEEPAKVPDLMAALEASLAATKKKPSAGTKAPAAKKPAARKPTAAAKKDGQPAKRAATRKKREKAKA